MVIIKKFGVLSLAKIQGVVMAVVGLIVGLVYGFFSILMAAFSGSGGAAVMGVFWIILFPILYGVMGFVIGAITAYIYNLVADKIGGVEMELVK